MFFASSCVISAAAAALFEALNDAQKYYGFSWKSL
jgi:hypothetical protein